MKRLILLLLILLSCSAKDTLPDITVKDIDGKSVNLGSYKNQKLVLYIWSRTCAGHTKDLKKLGHLVKMYPNYKIVSYAVAMEAGDVVESYRQLGIAPNFLTLIDTAVKFNDYFPITFLPSTYVFDKGGKLIASYAGLPDRL
ncbi:MAG: TlpA family protein disulfide reductase [Hydrogenobacter thermophilus]|uniref:TlpA family protein disulfide reductase n=1 Tax=Hydrogenobacter thermophilus TaxID=940 RepID=UPI0030FC573D|nr:TlpA family protein disulfide reductase [Hydrogenobacter thermophilus]